MDIVALGGGSRRADISSIIPNYAGRMELADKGLPCQSEINKREAEKRKKLQDLLGRLGKNDLVEFKLGYEVEGIKGKRDIQAMVRTIKRSYLSQVARDKESHLERIRIGWLLPKNAYNPILQEALPMLLQPPVQVRFIELSLNTQVSLSALQTLVSCHTLETLVLRSVKVRVSLTERLFQRPRTPQLGGEGRLGLHQTRPSKTSVNNDSIVAVVPFLSASIHSLKLANCGLQSHHMRGLVSCLREKRNLRCLSLRQNPQLRVDGWEEQFFLELPFLEDLDLSLCDFDPDDGLALANIIQQFPSVSDLTQHQSNYAGIRGLNLSGNYRLGPSVHSIVVASGQHGVSFLNCSFCDIAPKTQKEMFQALATMRPCSLRLLAMQGVRIKDIHSLIQCVQHNVSLKRLILDHPRERSPISTSTLVDIKDALKKNFHLEDIRVDHWCDDGHPVLREMQHEFELNRLGRGILDNEPHLNWSQVLGNVAANERHVDSLYWFLRNGATARLFQDVTPQ